jgi:transposase
MRKKYPSDISKEQFEKIREQLEWAKRKTNHRNVDLYDVFCAVLYVLKSGCQWRMLPSDFPNHNTVFYYFRIWRKKMNGKESILDKILRELVGMVREQDNRKEKTTFIIVDAQSVKNVDTAKEKGYDAGKKVSGIKRHISVDTQGLPHAICVTTANVTDRDGALIMFNQEKENLSDVLKVLVDGGYTGEKFANEVKMILNAEVEVAKRNELHKFVVLPKRWVVERSFSWLEKCRRLWKNCEGDINTSLQMVKLAFISLFLKRVTA